MSEDGRQQLKGFLAGLEMPYLADQCLSSSFSLIAATGHPINASAYLRDILQKTDMASCSKTARKYRYRSAESTCTQAVEQCHRCASEEELATVSCTI